MTDRDHDFFQRFIAGFLAGDAEKVGSAFGVIAVSKIGTAVGFFRLMEEFSLALSALQGGEDGADIAEAPFHDDFIFPIKLFFA